MGDYLIHDVTMMAGFYAPFLQLTQMKPERDPALLKITIVCFEFDDLSRVLR